MTVDIRVGDCREVLSTLDAESVQCCVTSPPYFGLRDYGVEGQLGLERTPDEYVERLTAALREVRRVLKSDGTLWLNLGDSYARAAEKGGSGPNGKNESRWAYGAAQSAKVGSSDGVVGRADRPGSRAIGDGVKPKDLLGIPWRVAFALQADGWYLRSDIIWHKPNPMPESVTDRPTKAHEYLFLLSKSERYFYDADAIAEPSGGWNGSEFHDGKNAIVHPNVGKNRSGNKERKFGEDRDRPGSHLGASIPWEGDTRNKRSVWTVATTPYSGAHFATFPPALIEPCILAGSRVGDTVLDPFGGAGTTGLVCDRLSRHALLIELNPQYAEMARRRIHDDAPLFSDAS